MTAINCMYIIYTYIIYIYIIYLLGLKLHRIDQNSSTNIPSHPFSFHFSDRSRLREGRNREPEGQWAASDWDVLGQMSVVVPDKLKFRRLIFLTHCHIQGNNFLCNPVPLSFGLQIVIFPASASVEPTGDQAEGSQSAQCDGAQFENQETIGFWVAMGNPRMFIHFN